MIVEAVLLSLIIGFLRKGRFRNFGLVDIKGIYFFMFGGLLQMFLFRMAVADGEGLNFWLYQEFYLLHLVSYGLILVPLLLNYKRVGMVLMGIGTVLNMIPIIFNEGKMPVKVPGGISEPIFDLGHTMMVATTKVKGLSDILYLSKPYPIPKVLSIGDLFIMVGVFWLIQTIMCSKTEMIS